jgi:putative membrane protein
MFLYIKALHIIFVVTWFAGLFYIVRLFVYYAETLDLPDKEREVLQPYILKWQRLLWYGITFPSAIITAVLGISVWYSGYNFVTPQWLWVKLGLVVGLYAYHFMCHGVFLQQQKAVVRYSGYQLRVWNEVATVFLFGIVFLAVLKNTTSMLWGLLGLIGLMVVLFGGIWVYKRIRTGK